MQSRVRRGRSDRFALPAGLGSIAARILPDQHEAGGASGIGCELKPTTGNQGQWPFRLGDHQTDRRCAQRLFGTPQEIGFPDGSQQVDPLPHPLWQAAQHRHFRRM